MYGDNIRAGLDEVVQILIGVRDHQMYIEHLVGRLAQRLNHRSADGDIRHEVTVHNVNVNVFRTGIGGNFNIACKICKICGQNRR